MELIGHRGGAALEAENTLDAIRAGLAAGADGVEVDARLTADGALVLMHDPDVARTTGAAGRVSEMTLQEIRSLGVVPTLSEALDEVPRDRLTIVELKGHPWEAGYDPNEPAARALGALLMERGEPERKLVVSSFNPLSLQVVREYAPAARTGVLTHAAFDLATNLASAIDGGHDECHVPAKILEEGFVAAAHSAGKRVLAWTVDDPAMVRAFARWGVDAVICDDPRGARRALTEPT